MYKPFSKDFSSSSTNIFKALLALGLTLYLILLITFLITQSPALFLIKWAGPKETTLPRTNLSHVTFGLMASVKAWPHRRAYIESWWRPNKTRGYLLLDKPPTPDLLPWPASSPPYRVVDNLTKLEIYRHTKPRFEVVHRMVHGILETFREAHGDMRWIFMGDDDSIFFVDNIVDVLAEYDHNKYYYLGWHSETILSNYWFSFRQAFGGSGIVLSYALAKALARGMDGCLVREMRSFSADFMTMTCIANIGVDITPQKGIHQVDLRRDLSGYLSSHPKVPVLTLHHFDAIRPIFPDMDRYESTRHLMKAADADQSRMLQQTICYHRERNWSISVSWGYSAHVYESILARYYLQLPIETFSPWAKLSPEPPFYMFDTRPETWGNPCLVPHWFFLDSVYKSLEGDRVVTTYDRARPRGLPACSDNGNHSAGSITRIEVSSPATKRVEVDRCECCDVLAVKNGEVKVKFRECKIDEIIA